MAPAAGISLAVEIGPGRLDLHRPSQQPAVAGLQRVIDGVLDDHWISSFWLRSMKGVHLFVDGRDGLGFIDEPLDFCVTGPGAEHRDRNRANVWPQSFPGLIAYRACRISCTTELLFSGDKAISSEAAASTIQNAGCDRNSMVTGGVAVVLST